MAADEILKKIIHFPHLPFPFPFLLPRFANLAIVEKLMENAENGPCGGHNVANRRPHLATNVHVLHNLRYGMRVGSTEFTQWCPNGE